MRWHNFWTTLFAIVCCYLLLSAAGDLRGGDLRMSIQKNPEDLTDEELLERIAAMDKTEVPLANYAEAALQEDDQS